MSALTKNPIVWQISKVENHATKGIQKITFFQTKYNDNTDYVDFETGEMYADYFQKTTSPTPVDETANKDKCVVTTATSSIKIGGGYKTITAISYDSDGNEAHIQSGVTPVWCFYVDDINVTNTDLIATLPTDNVCKIKVKFKGDSSYINKELRIACDIGGNVGEVMLNISSV